MGKGEATRQTIVEHAMSLASSLGLEGLSIGKLAADLKLSKSGLFAHFQSKETLQIQVLEAAEAEFSQTVVRPAVAQPRGSARVRALFENWIKWGKCNRMPGGCLFMSTAIEFDDRPGPVRDHLVKTQKEWVETISRIVATGVENGEFRKELDTHQFAQELYGIMLGANLFARLLRDPKAESRARAAFESMLAQAKSPNKKK